MSLPETSNLPGIGGRAMLCLSVFGVPRLLRCHSNFSLFSITQFVLSFLQATHRTKPISAWHLDRLRVSLSVRYPGRPEQLEQNRFRPHMRRVVVAVVATTQTCTTGRTLKLFRIWSTFGKMPDKVVLALASQHKSPRASRGNCHFESLGREFSFETFRKSR